MNRNMENSLARIKIFSEGIPHPEDIAIDQNGWLYTGSAIPDHMGRGPIYKISPDGKEVAPFADTRGRVLGLAFRNDGLLFTCDVQNHSIITVDRLGRCTVFADRVGDQKIQKPNYLVFDRSGNLIVSDSGTAKAGEATGAIYRFSPDGKGEILIDHLIFPNGITFDHEEEHLFVVLTRDNSVIKIPLGKDGQCGKPVLFAEGLINGPDGISINRQGRMFVTVTRPSQIIELSLEGERLLTVIDREDNLLAAPSNITFSGEKEEVLFIANLFGNHISSMNLACEERK